MIVVQNNGKKNQAAADIQVQEQERDNYCIAFIGTNRTGKTSVAKAMAKQWIEANPGREVVTFDPQLKFRDITTKSIWAHDKAWGQKLGKLRNCLLILDDYKLIHQKDRCIPELFELLNFRAAWNVDIIYITHSPGLVLNALTYYTTHYYIFYTLAQAGSFEKKIPNYMLCVTACRYINKYVSHYGKGEYPVFPYIIVDCERGKLIAQNLEHKKFMNIIKRDNNLV